jgi:hypothetical protein
MNPMMFPRMLTSHGEGWDWLKRIHPSVAKLYFLYVIPMSLIPPAMLLYAWRTYGGPPRPEITVGEAWVLAVVFFTAELVMVPIMGRVLQMIGQVVDASPSYQDAFTLAAVVPTPLWLAPVALFVPSLVFNILMMLLALACAAVLIFQGVDRTYDLNDEGHSLLLGGSVCAAGLVAWVIMLVLAFVTWGTVLA